MATSRRAIIVVFGVIVICALLGGFYGSRLGSAALASQRNAVEGHVRELENVLRVVERNYAGPIDLEHAIYRGAVPFMLRTLDPHSSFFDPDAFGRLREEQRGSYAGVGMQIRSYYGETIVDYPFPGTPAFRAGIRPGDVIARVDGVLTDDLSVEEVAGRVRGKEGTKVHLSLRRNGMDRLVEVDLVRASIPRPSVPLAFFIKPGVGYIRISNFNETTGREVDEALAEFEEKGLDGLVLDLRNNQGGLLTGGVHVADKFLEQDHRIVSHRGRASDERVYRAKYGARGSLYPMTVLVNCGSASAAEIVAGALQDHDRALIVGSNTFGKGLVQSVFDLPHNAGLVLTTARYYTPSGRLIQRPYGNVSWREYYADPCSDEYQPANVDPRLTDKGRPVYGGGGITPDVKLPELTPSSFGRRLQERRSYEAYAQQYSLEHEKITSHWEASRSVLEGFRSYLQSSGVAFTPEEFENELPQIRRLLKKNIYTACLNYDEGTRADTELDPAVARAIELLPQARALLEAENATLARQR